ncbi:MAG: hypothetical protein IKR11_02180, partial [Solobacterium sp.]|nr:hypothetical protein [Solobacterium sp.]
RYILRHAKAMPHLLIQNVKTEKISEGVYKVEAVICNTGFMPTNATNAFNTLKLARDIEVTISGAEAADGKPTKKIGQLEGYGTMKKGYTFFGPYNMEQGAIAKKAVWYVRAEQGTEITVSACSQKAGKASVTTILA